MVRSPVVLKTYIFQPFGLSVVCEVPQEKKLVAKKDSRKEQSETTRSHRYVTGSTIFSAEKDKNQNTKFKSQDKGITWGPSHHQTLRSAREMKTNTNTQTAQKEGLRYSRTSTETWGVQITSKDFHQPPHTYVHRHPTRVEKMGTLSLSRAHIQHIQYRKSLLQPNTEQERKRPLLPTKF